jgi:high-affinity Fe2+/Pb2+ permease
MESEKQNKKYSLIESIIQAVVGLIFSFLIQIVIYPILDIPVTFKQNIVITIVFFVASVFRGYVIRRIFNKIKQNEI